MPPKGAKSMCQSFDIVFGANDKQKRSDSSNEHSKALGAASIANQCKSMEDAELKTYKTFEAVLPLKNKG